MNSRSRIVYLILSVFLFSTVSAEEPVGTDQFSLYQGIYFIGGYGDLVDVRTIDWIDPLNPVLAETLRARQLFKISFSTKFQFFNEYKSGLFIGYTQVMFWNLLGESAPFVETDYSPELFWSFTTKDNFLDDTDLGFFDHFKLGLKHDSTGVEGADSRGFDRLYAEIGVGAGEGLRLELDAKYYLYLYQFMPSWYVAETVDIQDYRSNFEFGLKLDFADETPFFLPQTIMVKGAPGGGYNSFDWLHGYVLADVTFGSIFGGLRAYAQFFMGYGEGWVNYDSYSMAARIGISVE
jgi:outer membrane phospholipase A